MCRVIKKLVYILGSRILLYILVTVDKTIKVKIVRLHSARIGHLIFNFENFYFNYYSPRKKTKHIYIILLDKSISNKKILRLLKQKLRALYFHGFLVYLLEGITSQQIRDRFYVPWDVLHPPKSKIACVPSLILNKDLGNMSVISKLKLEKGLYVVFHSRDDLYLHKFKLEDGNNHSYRNFNFADFNSSINYLRSKNIKAVRIGKISEHDFNKIEYLNLSNTKFNDELKLISESKFFVSGNTGIAQMSTLLRKPQLYVNYLPLRLDHLASMAPNSIVIPKYIFKNDLSRLNLKDLFRVSEDWSIHDFDYVKKQKLIIENNSEADILIGIQQMQNSLEIFKENTIPDQSESIYKYIVDLMSDKDFASYVFFDLKIRFSNNFLKQHL